MWSDVWAGRAAFALGAPQRLWPLALALLVVVCGLLVARRRGGPIASGGLRLAALGLLALALADLSIEVPQDTQRLCVVVSTDVSASVADRGRRLGDELVRDLATRLRPEDRLGAVVFARQARIVTWPSAPPRPSSFDAADLDRSGTRLASGIEAAVPMCPENAEKKLVLVTDGNETAGDARRAADLARETHTRIYAELPGAGGHGEGVLLEKLVAPPLVREGSVFAMRAVVRNGFEQAKRATLDFLVDGAPAAEEVIRLDPGINVFEVPYQLHERGSYRLAARLVPEGAAGEERREATVAVAGPIRALLVTRVRDSALARALRMREVQVERRDPANFPTLDELLQYHCVIFDDLRRSELSNEALEAVESYVKTFGGGFLMTGGPGSFGDKGFQKSALERVLPVRLIAREPKGEGRPPMGLFLLIDRSNSMGYNSRQHDVRDGEKMRYARQAARALVEQLRPEDHVGVIAFDSDPYVLGPLRALSEQRAVLEDRIARLVPGGGTDFKAAMEIATAQLVQSKLKTLHVILLTDGDTNRGADDHAAVIRAMARLGISVTTIRIGDDDVNLEFLKRISRDTGGRFYHVDDIELLPELIVNDTREAGGEKKDADHALREAAATAGPQRPVVGEPTEVVRGLTGLRFPLVREVPPTRLKGGADLVLYVGDEPRRQPLLATWQYGLGRSGAFPLDPARRDAGSWAAWPGFAKLWSQLVRWAAREEAPWETRQTVRFRDGVAVLEVQTFDDIGGEPIEAQLFTDAQTPVDLALTPVGPRLYRAPLPPLPPGKYALRLSTDQPGRAQTQKRDVITIDAALGEAGAAETARRDADVELLREITTETGGSLGPSIEELTARHGARTLARRRLDWLLVPLALALLFADIALRLRAESG